MLVSIFESWVKMIDGILKSGELCLRDLSSRQCIYFKLGTLSRTAHLGSHPKQIRKQLDSSISRWDMGTEEKMGKYS